MSQYATIEDVKDAYSRNGGGHFFEPGTMRFFRSRLSQDAIESDNGSDFVFVTSEQRSTWLHTEPRLYTVRHLHIPAEGSADIRTVGEFQEHGTRYLAWKAAKAEMLRIESGAS